MSGSRRPGIEGPTPATIVVFGSSGNLATTKVIPAIETEVKAGRLRDLVGVDRRRPRQEAPPWFTFVLGDLASQETYARLAEKMEDRVALFYLATPPRLFPEIVRRLEDAGLNRPGSRVAVEKPFGVDLASSRLLERRLRSAFPRRRTFRVDHFLCKDGAVALARFRFAYGELEPMWSNRFVDSVQIMADEDSAVRERGEFYDSAGVLRDMVQNHLLQLLCLVAMERPDPSGDRSSARAKAELLKSIAPIPREDVAWGQYRGYERVSGVRKGSRTPTFVALKLQVRNRRWGGVPFYLRSGRPLARDATEVVVEFRGGSAADPNGPLCPRAVRFGIDPEARTVLTWRRSERAWRDRRPSRGQESAAQRVLRGALKRDQEMFVDDGFNELSWKLFDPLVRDQGNPEGYGAGGWGPASSDLLLARDGRSWMDGRSGAWVRGRRWERTSCPPSRSRLPS